MNGGMDMRRLIPLLLALVFACALGVGQPKVYAAEAGALALPEKGERVEMEIRNDALYPVCVYVTAPEESGGVLRLQIRQAGRTATVFEGSADALSRSRVLLCTLDPDGSARLFAGVTEGEGGGTLSVTKVPAEDPGETDRLRLLFFVCVWIALAVFGAYLVVAVHRRMSGRNGEE